MIYDFEVQIMQGIQAFITPFLDLFFQGVTMIGEETFYILAFCMIYWCYDKNVGKELGLTFLLGSVFNAGIKELFHLPRPIGTKGIRSLRVETATGYSFPSGHTQSTTTFFYFWILKVKKTWFRVLAWILILMVGFSRLYLGVHWPKDVLGGIVFAIISVHFGRQFFREVTTLKVVFSVAIVNLLCLFFHSEGYVVGAALFSSAMIGFYLESKIVNFENQKIFRWKTLRLILGLVVLLSIKEGVKIILPDLLVIDYFRYFLIGIWVTLFSGMVFKKIRI